MIQPTSNRVFIFMSPTDMRKSYDTLAALVTQNSMDPLCGDLFVFTNRNKNRLKVLLWEDGGYWLCAKRLEEGIFSIPFANVNQKETYTLKINITELRMLIEGFDLKKIQKNARFIKKEFTST